MLECKLGSEGAQRRTFVLRYVTVGLLASCHVEYIDDSRLGAYQWPGYNEYKRQVIMFRDQTYGINQITIARFAYNIGCSVEAFLRVSLLRHVLVIVLNYIAA